MWTSVLFVAKNIASYKIFGVSAWLREERGLNQCRHFADKGG